MQVWRFALHGQQVEFIMKTNGHPFLTDVKRSPVQARQHIEKGALAKAYQGAVSQTIVIFQTA